MRAFPCLLLALGAAGCVHPLAAADLDRVIRPAFVSRIEEGAGPKSTVFRDDSSYKAKLGRLDAKEADRRLSVKLGQAMSRFEISDRLRATTLALLPKERPWTETVDPTQVASALESFLVDEVPANPPDFDLLKPLGVDAVVEFVIEDYGMRSSGGHAGFYLVGHGRMFFIGGPDIWYRGFKVDQIDSGVPHQDPFAVAKEITKESHGALYVNAMEQMIDAVAAQFAKDLNPPDRHAASAPPSTGAEKAGPDDTNRTGKENEPPKKDELAPGELPAPDAPAPAPAPVPAPEGT